MIQSEFDGFGGSGSHDSLGFAGMKALVSVYCRVGRHSERRKMWRGHDFDNEEDMIDCGSGCGSGADIHVASVTHDGSDYPTERSDLVLMIVVHARTIQWPD